MYTGCQHICFKSWGKNPAVHQLTGLHSFTQLTGIFAQFIVALCNKKPSQLECGPRTLP